MYNPKEIKRLALEEGMNDRMIAEELNCDRTTVTRIRKRNNIPKCNVNNRRDKSYICIECGKKVFIKRTENKRLLCNECLHSKNIAGNK